MVEASTGPHQELQAEEVESLTYIYPEEFELISENPYKFEIMINSNTEDEELNFLKVKVTWELSEEYPDKLPYFRIKNLSPDYMDNTLLDQYETEMKRRGEESIGSGMVFELCDYLKEKCTEINDEVCNKLRLI